MSKKVFKNTFASLVTLSLLVTQPALSHDKEQQADQQARVKADEQALMAANSSAYFAMGLGFIGLGYSSAKGSPKLAEYFYLSGGISTALGASGLASAYSNEKGMNAAEAQIAWVTLEKEARITLLDESFNQQTQLSFLAEAVNVSPVKLSNAILYIGDSNGNISASNISTQFNLPIGIAESLLSVANKAYL